MKVDLSPAPLERRIIAGVIDGAILVALCAAYFMIPTLLLGITLPMWGVLAAIIGYSVVPLAVFRQTPGMRMFDIELVGKTGHAVALGDVLFRELIGRGWFPAAFLFNLLFGYVAMSLGYARFSMPTGLQGLFFLASMFALALAVLGGALAVTSTERRSIADLMSKSWVVPRQARELPEDREEREDLDRARARSIRNVIIAEVIIAVFGLGAPWLLTRRTESTDQRAARLLRAKLEAQFKEHPESEQVSRELERAFWAAGDSESANKIASQHQAVVLAEKDKRLTAQLELLDKRPGDDATFMAVLQTLEERGQLDNAKVLYDKFIVQHRLAEYRAGYADWLMHNGFTNDAVLEMQALLKEEPEFDGVHKFLAQAYVMAERLGEAQEEYQRELILDPADEDALDAMNELNQTLGPLPKAKVAALEKELRGSKKKSELR